MDDDAAVNGRSHLQQRRRIGDGRRYLLQQLWQILTWKTAVPAGEDRISALPAELRLAIVSFIEKKKDLRKICLLSKAWNDCATPALWETMTLPNSPILAQKFSTLLSHGSMEAIKHVRSFELPEHHRPEQMRKYYKFILPYLPQERIVKASFYEYPLTDILALVETYNHLTDLAMELPRPDPYSLEPRPYSVQSRQFALTKLALVFSKWCNYTHEAHLQFFMCLPLMVDSPDLKHLSISFLGVDKEYLPGKPGGEPSPLIDPLLSKLFAATRSTPIVELKLRGVDLVAIGRLDLSSISFRALKLLHLERCHQIGALLDILSNMHEQLRDSGHKDFNLRTFSYVPLQCAFAPPYDREMRLVLKRFLASFSGLVQLTIMSYETLKYTDGGPGTFSILPTYALFMTHASTLKYLLIGLEKSLITNEERTPWYPQEEIALICANCRNLEQLGLPLLGQDGVPEYISEFANLPKLHTLRITSGHNKEWRPRKKKFARSCLTTLVREGSPIQISALLPMEIRKYYKEDFAVWQLRHKEVLSEGRVGWIEVDNVKLEDLDELKVDILDAGVVSRAKSGARWD